MATKGLARFVVVALAWCACPAAAQTPVGGNVSFTFDRFPSTTPRASEFRVRLFADTSVKRGVLTLRAAGFAEGLLADRGPSKLGPYGADVGADLGRPVTDAIVRAQELYAEVSGGAVDLRAGFSRIVWGRLDELQPGDVINPLDLSKFFFEGRSEARLPVLLVRGRWHFKEGSAFEGVLVPKFQPGHFDQLDEDSSPFNLLRGSAPGPGAVARVEEPRVAWRNLQGGVRLTTTTKRVDWAVAAYRGFDAFPTYRVDAPNRVIGTHPRRSTIGGDFESVLGEWGIRGEVVGVLDRSIQAGVGLDRRSGVYRFSAATLVERTFGGRIHRTDATFIGSAERTFARETRLLRGLALYNATEGTAFLRAIGSISLRDNLSLEGSGGLFAGEGQDVIGLFRDRDFLYARVKFYF